jgi:hypothetical protein
LSNDAAKLRGSSKFKSSNALPVKQNIIILLSARNELSDTHQSVNSRCNSTRPT